MLIVHDPTPLLKTFMEHQPAHEFAQDMPRLRWRQERADILLDLWARGDVRGFSLVAGEYLWEDPDIAALLPPEAAAKALKLVSQAAIRLHRQGLR